MYCLRSKNVAGPIESSVIEARNQLLLSYVWKVLANVQHGIFMGWLMETWLLVGGWWLMGLLSKVQGSVVWQVSDASFLMHRWHWWIGSLGNQFWCFMWLWRGNKSYFFPPWIWSIRPLHPHACLVHGWVHSYVLCLFYLPLLYPPCLSTVYVLWLSTTFSLTSTPQWNLCGSAFKTSQSLPSP